MVYISYEEDDFELQIETDPNIADEESVLRDSNTSVKFTYKVRGRPKYYYVFKNKHLLAENVRGKKVMLKIDEFWILTLTLAILQLNLRVSQLSIGEVDDQLSIGEVDDQLGGYQGALNNLIFGLIGLINYKGK